MNHINVSKLSFDIVYQDMLGEGYKIEKNIDKSVQEQIGKDDGFLTDLSRETILDFLNMDETKVHVVVNKDGKAEVVAYNYIANESIKIDGLGDHFLALIYAVSGAEKARGDKKVGKNNRLLTHSFIKGINKRLLSLRYEYEEAAIGRYRYKTMVDTVYEVYRTMRDDDGHLTRSQSANIETAADRNVMKKMVELVDWVNDEAFKDGRDKMHDLAEFHCRFVQIHPFADGNKRTGRLLTHYLSIVNDLPLVDINEENRDEYLRCVYYATASSEALFRNERKDYKAFDDKVLAEQGCRTDENKYLPLKRFFEKNQIAEHSKKVISDILRYDGGSRLHADQVLPE